MQLSHRPDGMKRATAARLPAQFTDASRPSSWRRLLLGFAAVRARRSQFSVQWLGRFRQRQPALLLPALRVGPDFFAGVTSEIEEAFGHRVESNVLRTTGRTREAAHGRTGLRGPSTPIHMARASYTEARPGESGGGARDHQSGYVCIASDTPFIDHSGHVGDTSEKKTRQRGVPILSVYRRRGMASAVLAQESTALPRAAAVPQPPQLSSANTRCEQTRVLVGWPMETYRQHDRRRPGPTRIVCRTCGAQVCETHHPQPWGTRMRLLVCLGLHCGAVDAAAERRRFPGTRVMRAARGQT